MRIKKWNVALAIMAIVAIGATTATANHVFNDLPDERFYANHAEWAKDVGITVGCNGGADFCGENNITRGENITFAGRYHNWLVTTLAAMWDSDQTNSVSTNSTNTPLDTGLSATVTIPDGHTGVIEILFTAESACYSGTGYCVLDILLDGTDLGDTVGGYAFNSSDGATETSGSWEGLASVELTDELTAGTYTITVTHWTGGGTTSRLDEMRLVAEAHLTGFDGLDLG